MFLYAGGYRDYRCIHAGDQRAGADPQAEGGQILRQLEERETLQSMYGRSMLTFRSAFTAQWVKGYLSLSEIEEKASLLGINLTVESFTVVRFWSGDASNREMSLFFDTLLQQLPGHYTACFCFETPQCLIGVFSPLPSFSY